MISSKTLLLSALLLIIAAFSIMNGIAMFFALRSQKKPSPTGRGSVALRLRSVWQPL